MTGRSIFLVEGSDDEHVIYAILKRHAFDPVFKIEEPKGLDALLSRLRLELKPGTDLERLGIVIDSDRDFESRWQGLRRILIRAGYTDTPDAPDPTGTVLTGEFLPRIGVWLMPNNVTAGTLEDFLASLVRESDALWLLAQKCLDEVIALECRFAAQYRLKALIHTFLAWQDDPGLPMGRAIGRGFFRAEGPHVDALIAWLNRLFA